MSYDKVLTTLSTSQWSVIIHVTVSVPAQATPKKLISRCVLSLYKHQSVTDN